MQKLIILVITLFTVSISLNIILFQKVNEIELGKMTDNHVEKIITDYLDEYEKISTSTIYQQLNDLQKVVYEDELGEVDEKLKDYLYTEWLEMNNYDFWFKSSNEYTTDYFYHMNKEKLSWYKGKDNIIFSVSISKEDWKTKIYTLQ